MMFKPVKCSFYVHVKLDGITVKSKYKVYKEFYLDLTPTYCLAGQARVDVPTPDGPKNTHLDLYTLQ